MSDFGRATEGNSYTRNRLTLYPPKNEAVADMMSNIRELMINVGERLEIALPPGRELSLALMKLEECCFWSIAAIARNQDQIKLED